MAELTALIDADIIAYRLASAYTSQPNSLIDEREQLTESLRSTFARIKERTGATEYYGFLSDSKTFRHEVAKTRPYKGNRKGRQLPMHLDLIKQILIDKFGCILLRGIEADDGLSIVQKRQKNTIICSIDKDLMQVPGLHYNFVKEEITTISIANAKYNLFMQVLTGDSTDNIEGLPGIGPKTAEGILRNVSSDKLHEVVLTEYLKHFPINEAIARFAEMFALVYLLGGHTPLKLPQPRKFL